MSTVMNYQELKELLVSSANTSLGGDSLLSIKNSFVTDINSNRRFSCINSCEELISVLEKRGVVGERCITALFRISELIGSPDLQRQMLRYDEYVAMSNANEGNEQGLSPPVNQYGHILTQPRSLYSENWQRSSGSRNSSNYFSSVASTRGSELEAKLPEDVIELICREIGRSWVELARKLNVREAEIDDISARHSMSTKEKSREVLKIYQKGMHPQKWHFNLLNALVEARRRDVKEGVEELLARQCNT